MIKLHSKTLKLLLLSQFLISIIKLKCIFSWTTITHFPSVSRNNININTNTNRLYNEKHQNRYNNKLFNQRIIKKVKRDNISLHEKNNLEEEEIVIIEEEDTCTETAINGNTNNKRREIELSWCNREGECYINTLREVSDDQNRISFLGPATGQVNYRWKQTNDGDSDDTEQTKVIASRILLLVKRNDEDLLEIAANTIKTLIDLCSVSTIKILIQEDLANELQDSYSNIITDDMYTIFEPIMPPGFGSNRNLDTNISLERGDIPTNSFITPEHVLRATSAHPDLVCTLGGDGLLMYACSLFPSSVPPILCVTGGTMGFLTKFKREEIVDSIIRTLGLITNKNDNNKSLKSNDDDYDEFYDDDDDAISVSMRMRLECRVIDKNGIIRARYNVLNEVVIDRGSSPYLSNLECFVDNVHLTTVQADGIIFATPTGSTAYSMAAGGSVVHPAVPCILVTPICPHVLSFRSMVFPDHVILRCYVPDDSRAESASVAFDGKYHHDLHRGESVQIQMSMHPVPTINRLDHSSDWLDGLHTSFNFNTRVKQKPFPNNKNDENDD